MDATISLKYNSATVHIDGLEVRTEGSEFNYSLTPCSALTRSTRMCTAKGQHATAADALAAAVSLARSLGKKLCKNCVAAAEAQAAAEVAAPVVKTTRQALGPASVTGWELLYDKPKQGCEVGRRFDAQGKAHYALICKTSGTVHRLARLSDEGQVRKTGGWCPDCQH
ncbi:hypothetical protein AB0M39_41505 [Streptomyces sp. NPDC051907]|uniref:hypothetical protein n=1 Tax=Streptomyces sp. NPDC051907 TaxID=3155284 RepID=UPI00343F29C3